MLDRGAMVESVFAPAPRAWDVAALLLAAGDALQASLGAVAVRGELAGFSRAASGHCYFSLKDANGAPALLRCAMFRRAAALLDFVPQDGQQVELRGRIAVYEARGELQCVVEAMGAMGAGSLYELFLRLRERLLAEGLFDAGRKRAIAQFPRAVGVLTSLSAAALHDVASALARRAPQVRVVIYPAAVQGAQAPAQIVAAIASANATAEVDTLIVCRGGGSLEDLWAFNDERVVRAIASSRLPIVCGVGHETDLTLAELAADLRAPTPTAAAELAAPARAELIDSLAGLAARLARALQHRINVDNQRLDNAAHRLGRSGALTGPHGHRLALLQQRWQSTAQRLLATQRLRVAHRHHAWAEATRHGLQLSHANLLSLAGRLDALDPQAVLRRGYSLVESAAAGLVTSPEQLHEGEQIRITSAGGRAELTPQRVRRLP
jgi:exodeoxyribonuclease VII large subunit